MDALTTYKLYAANSEKSLERISNSPLVSREVEYYLANISSVKTPEEFVNEPRLLNFALKAFGLEEMSYAKAFMQKMLEGGTTDESSLANQLTDPRYREFVEAFNFVQFTTAATSFDKAQQGVVDRYYQQTLEQEAGNENTGARLAIYFERKAPEITNAFDILGDPALIQVFQSAFGFSSNMSFSSIDKQAEIINERIDFEDLQDPEKLGKLVNRFLVGWETQNPSNVSVPPLIAAPFGQSQSLSLDLLASVQNFRNR